MSTIHTSATKLERLATILVSGQDARSFLQGQISSDIDALTRERVLLTSCNSPQGRVQSIAWLIERNDDIVLLLSAAMMATTITRLRKYVLRAKVQIAPGDDRLQVGALDSDAAHAPIEIADRTHHVRDGIDYVRLPGHDRLLVLVPAGFTLRSDSSVGDAWHLEDIRAGMPQIHPQTHEAFVAQMLNLDLLGGISFEKGCYTGQEIIARTHYRGAIKRRMFRFAAACPPPSPGTRLLQGEQHAGDVVDAAATAEGCELLAVVNLTQADQALELESARRTPLRGLSPLLPQAPMNGTASQ